MLVCRSRQTAKNRQSGFDAARGNGGARPRGTDAERKERKSSGGAGGVAGAAEADDLSSERRRLVGGEYGNRRGSSVECNSAAQRSAGARHRRVSAEQGGAVMRIVSGGQADAMVDRLAARVAQPSGLEPQVRRIIDGVRRGRDRSLRRYAERWDGLAAKQSLRVSDEEMAAASRAISPALRKSLRQATQNIRR